MYLVGECLQSLQPQKRPKFHVALNAVLSSVYTLCYRHFIRQNYFKKFNIVSMVMDTLMGKWVTDPFYVSKCPSKWLTVPLT